MSEKPRILQFVTSFDVGGTERHVASLVRRHDRDRVEIHIGCHQHGQGFSDELAGAAASVATFPVHRLYGAATWRQQLRLARHLRSHDIQVVHAYGFYANCFVLPAAALARVPVILASIRDIGATWTPAQRRVERWVCRLAHSVLTNADAVKQRLVDEGYRPDKISVIRNGVDTERFRPRHGGGRFRAELELSDEAPLVGAISRIQSVKGLEHFIDAAAVVSRNVPGARFVVVGDTFPSQEQRAYRRSLEERAAAAGLADVLTFAGSRSDIPEVLAALDVSVLASLTEGLPNVVLESMASGVPVIATRVGGTPEVIDHGVNGLLVPPGDAARMAEAIEKLLRHPERAREMAARGRETACSGFSVERMVRLTEDHYVDLLRSRGIAQPRAGGDRTPKSLACASPVMHPETGTEASVGNGEAPSLSHGAGPLAARTRKTTT